MLRLMNSFPFGRGPVALLRISLLFISALLCSTAMAAASVYCPTQSLTVAQGASVVSVDLASCDGPFDIGMGGPPTAAQDPTHGTIVLGPQAAGGSQFVTYAHNGDAATTDTFGLEDQDGGILTFNVTITPPASAIIVSPATLPTVTAGTPFSLTLTSTGGAAPYTYSLTAGSLPLGLTLSPAGTLSGTPTQRGGYSFSVRSQDSIGAFVIKGYTGTVQNPSLSISPGTATAIQGVPFSQTVTAIGGVAPHSYMLETGAFPPGISISSAGVVSGTTAAAPGSYPVTLRVTDSSTGPGSYFELESFTLSVSPPPSVSISVAPASVSEDGAANLLFTVTRSLNIASPTVVNITTSGTATSGTDYSGGVATLVIPGGATTATITINPTTDSTVEADETVVLTVAAGAGYSVGAPASATGTILNDDVPSASIAVAPAAVAEDGAANLVYTVTLSQAALTSTSVNFTVGGTATNGTDYAAVVSPLSIAAGSTTGTITVNPTADVIIEADESVVIGLAAGAAYTVGAPASATGTILNDDLPTLGINDVTLAEGNAGTSNATFTVSLGSPAGPGGVTFDIATANGTATAGSDYVANSLTGQTIAAGSSTYTFTVLVNGDLLNEPSETFFVNVTNVTGAIIADGQGVGTITNDDPLPSLSINDASVVEGNSGTVNAVFTVSLSAASGQTVTVNYATANGIAIAPTDYTAASGTLTFTPGQTTQTITVLVNGDITPEPTETFTVGLSGATNATIAVSPGTGTITNDDVPVTIIPTSVPSGNVGIAYSQTITASGGTSPYAFAVTAGALPAGLSLSAGGALSGTPTAGGSFNFTITATDASATPGPYSGSQSYTLVIGSATVTLAPTTLGNGTLGTAYSASLNPATGGTAPYAYALTAGSLPGGLTLNSATGQISGTPSALGTFNFSLTATDSSTGTGPYTATQAYSIEVIDVAPIANPVSLTVAYNSIANPVTLSLTGGPPVSVAVVTPAAHGSAIASGTTITYQPTTGFAGSDSFSYTATNTGGTSAAAVVTVTVSNPVITVTPSGGFAATAGVAYTQTFTWAGGAAPYGGYAVTNLPAGLAITGTTATSATISGTPTAAGSFSLNASATDSSTGNGPFTIGQAFTLTVAPPVLALTPTGTTFNATYATAYTQAFVASGGVGPYTYALSGSSPPGLSFAAGTLSGTPTTPGSYAFSITATDAGATGSGAPFTVIENYTLDVSTPTIVIAPATVPDPVIATPYSQVLTASGGVAPYSYSISAGALPAGLTLSTAGALSGTTNVVGSFNFTVTASDGNSQTATASFTVTIAAPTLALNPAGGSFNVGYGSPYSQTYTASGGAGPYTYALGGTPPSGLTFAGDTLSGTPTAPGSYNVSITATDTGSTGTGAPFTIVENYTLVVSMPSIVVDPASLPDAAAGAPYAQTLTASGGVSPYAFSISSGNLPAGLSLASNGALSGIPTASGSAAFDVLATDANGQTGSMSYVLAVTAPTLELVSATLPSGQIGSAYAASLNATGGLPPYQYAVTSGSLPPGLTLDASGQLTGTPTASALYTFVVTASDSDTPAASVSATFTLAISALPPAQLPTLNGAGLLLLLSILGIVGVARLRRQYL